MLLGLSTACPATSRSASATAYLSDRPNWPTFLRGRAAYRRHKTHPCWPAYPSFVQATASRSAELNIAAARVAPECRTQRGTPRPATGGRSVAATAERRKVQKRIPTGKLVPRQACPKYARVAQSRAGSNSQVVDTTTWGNRWRDLKSADLNRSWGFKSPSGHHRFQRVRLSLATSQPPYAPWR